MIAYKDEEIDNMVFSDCSSDKDVPQVILKNGLGNISECNESSECGKNDCDNFQNLDFLNQKVFLA